MSGARYALDPPPEATPGDVAEAEAVLDEDAIRWTGLVHAAAGLHLEGGIHSSFWTSCGILLWEPEATDPPNAEITCPRCAQTA